MEKVPRSPWMNGSKTHKRNGGNSRGEGAPRSRMMNAGAAKIAENGDLIFFPSEELRQRRELIVIPQRLFVLADCQIKMEMLM